MIRAFLLGCLAALPLVAAETPAWRPFSPDSPWNRRIPATAAVDPESPTLIEDLASRGEWHINLKDWSIPVYFVEAERDTPARCGRLAHRCLWRRI